MSEQSARDTFRNAAKGYGRAGTADWPGGPYMSMDDAAGVYANLTTNAQSTVGKQINRIKGVVSQYREAPFRSADWLAGELLTILDTEAANDRDFLSPDAARSGGENNLPACKTCGAPAGLDCRTGQGRIQPCYGREEPVKWLERWYGSEPQKGSAIVDERGNLIAYFGGDKATHKATTAVVAAHNSALTTTPARNTSQIGEG